MKNRASSMDVRWMASGVVVMALLWLLLWLFHQDPAQQLALKATRVDLVGRMQLALTAASEAQKSAVLAATDQDSQAFADQARAATARLERDREELAKLLTSGGTERERDLLAQFSDAFGTLRHVDEEVLRLAEKNTNLKAYALLFGPAADALGDMDSALARVVAKRASSADAKQVMLLTFTARLGLLRIHTLLARHIPEESDPRMDQLEASMREEETKVRDGLARLGLLAALSEDADLAAAASSFARYGEIKARILALSRENTNVRSLELSVGQRRNAAALCVEPLDALKQAILDEPIAGVSYGKFPTR